MTLSVVIVEDNPATIRSPGADGGLAIAGLRHSGYRE